MTVDRTQPEKIILQKIQYGMQIHIPYWTILDASLDVNTIVADYFVYKFTQFIMGKQRERVFETPLNWWEHFKQDVFPKWLLDKFPVKYKKTTIVARMLFPDVVPPKNQKVLYLLDYDNITKSQKTTE